MSDEDSDDETNGQRYICQNEGCRLEDRVFLEAPEKWYEDSNLSMPTNCPECREWRRAQQHPLVATCCYCAFKWNISAGQRRNHHKNIGNWEDYWEENEDSQICHRCAEEPGRKHRLIYRKAVRQHKEKDITHRQLDEVREKRERNERGKTLLHQALEKMRRGIAPKAYRVPSEITFYANVETPEELKEEHGETQLKHILKPRHKWRKKFGTDDPQTILGVGARIAASTEKGVFEFVNKKGWTVKYDTRLEVVVFIRGAEESPTKNLIHTSYSMSPNAVHKKVEDGKWR